MPGENVITPLRADSVSTLGYVPTWRQPSSASNESSEPWFNYHADAATTTTATTTTTTTRKASAPQKEESEGGFWVNACKKLSDAIKKAEENNIGVDPYSRYLSGL